MGWNPFQRRIHIGNLKTYLRLSQPITGQCIALWLDEKSKPVQKTYTWEIDWKIEENILDHTCKKWDYNNKKHLNCFLFKVKLLVLNNSVLPELGYVLLTSRICLECFYQCRVPNSSSFSSSRNGENEEWIAFSIPWGMGKWRINFFHSLPIFLDLLHSYIWWQTTKITDLSGCLQLSAA